MSLKRDFREIISQSWKMTGGRRDGCPNNLSYTNRCLEALGLRNLLKEIRFVHVAGTKGKGTTATYTAALLKAYGYKVGLFTSPHLMDVRERIVVDGEMLSEERFSDYFLSLYERFENLYDSPSQLVREAAENRSLFRFLFILALEIFKLESVEVAVIEVGIGGKIDSTNLIVPEVSVITSLGYDHMELLGNTIEEIAADKAGIIKPNVPCFCAPQKDHPEARPVIERIARENQSAILFLDDAVFPISQWPELSIGGNHMIENSKLALMAARQVAGIAHTNPLSMDERAVLSTLRLLGRSQVYPIGGETHVTLFMDGAHTPESINHATKWFLKSSDLASSSGDDTRRILVFYTSRDPELLLKVFMPFASFFSKAVFVPIKSGNVVRKTAVLSTQEVVAETAESWKNLYPEVPCISCSKPFASLEEILDTIVPSVSPNQDAPKPAHVFITGSFFLIGEILTILKANSEQN